MEICMSEILLNGKCPFFLPHLQGGMPARSHKAHTLQLWRPVRGKQGGKHGDTTFRLVRELRIVKATAQVDCPQQRCVPSEQLRDGRLKRAGRAVKQLTNAVELPKDKFEGVFMTFWAGVCDPSSDVQRKLPRPT